MNMSTDQIHREINNKEGRKGRKKEEGKKEGRNRTEGRKEEDDSRQFGHDTVVQEQNHPQFIWSCAIAAPVYKAAVCFTVDSYETTRGQLELDVESQVLTVEKNGSIGVAQRRACSASATNWGRYRCRRWISALHRDGPAMASVKLKTGEGPLSHWHISIITPPQVALGAIFAVMLYCCAAC